MTKDCLNSKTNIKLFTRSLSQLEINLSFMSNDLVEASIKQLTRTVSTCSGI